MFQLKTGERLASVVPLTGAFLSNLDGSGSPFLIKGRKIM